MKISSLFTDGSDSLLLYDTTTSATESIPVPLRVGDIDLDGFPDIVPIVVHKDNARTPHVLISHPCVSSNTNGCSGSAGRTFEVVTKDTHALEKITDAVGVAFLDIDEDVSEICSSLGCVSTFPAGNDVTSRLGALRFRFLEAQFPFTRGASSHVLTSLIATFQGTWDFMVQRTGKQSSQRVTFIQNNFFHDAFFLKAIGRSHPCEPIFLDHWV